MTNTYSAKRVIRFSDVDMFGHVHNLSQIQYAEDAGVELVRSMFRELAIEDSGFYGIAHVNARFASLLPWRATEVSLLTRISRITARCVTFETDVTSKTGTHSHVTQKAFRIGTDGQPRRVSDEERNWLVNYLVPPAE
ncbi:acyl-CoA thioesterase [Streptomyces chartreusis]|uniref:acyl-CoA thioesterase n=1 Tax=Streptomyces chartreusis TaxID=1969 RepID=UPI002E1780EC